MNKSIAVGLLALALSACSPTKNSTPGGDSLDSTPHPEQHTTHTELESRLGEELDFWNNLYSGFQLDYHLNQRAVHKNIQWFEKHPDYIQQALQRAQPFLDYIATEIENKQLPLELILIPLMESAYNPHAYSHAGAAGIWQLMPVAADRFGVTQNWWYDGRRDIQDSTQAALTYLSFLHNKFKDDWLLCLAAYNSGEGTIDRAIHRNKQLGLKTDFWSLKLPSATRQYVPRWLALSATVKNLVVEKHQRGESFFPDMSDNPKLTSVPLNTQMDLAIVAKLSKLDVKDIYSLNPGFNRWATDPLEKQHLLLPEDNAQSLVAQMNNLAKDKLISWDRYKIKAGDTLSGIAKRLKTTTDTLKMINHMKNNQIIAGRDLLVPKHQALT